MGFGFLIAQWAGEEFNLLECQGVGDEGVGDDVVILGNEREITSQLSCKVSKVVGTP